MDKVTEMFTKIKLENDILPILVELVKEGLGEGQDQKSVLEEFLNTRMTAVLEEGISKNTQYQNTGKEINRKIEKINEIKLNRMQWMVVDEALSACNQRSSIYSRAAYRQGFMDAVNLLMELSRL